MKIGASTFAVAPEGPLVFGIPVDFILFGLTLLRIALFHRHTLRVALAGSATMAIYKIVFTGFKTGPDHFPFTGMVVLVAILLSIPLRRPDWETLPAAFKASIFLVSLVLGASMMPVEKLPLPSWQTALGLGFLSAVFDNIPLTALALRQDGYDWGFLASSVGFGGSMIWFGSSSGVALSNIYPEAKSVWRWFRHGWYIPVAYLIGFLIMLVVCKWHPDALD